MLFERTNAASPEMEAQARRHRDHMAGLWAAELLGLIGQAAQDYARDLARCHEATVDDEHVVGHLARDLNGKVANHEIRVKLSHLLHQARRQLGNRDGLTRQ